MTMSLSAFLAYFHSILVRVPWWHWTVICVLALTVFFFFRKKGSVFGAFSLGMTVFVGLLLLDSAVMIRYLGLQPHMAGCNLRVELSLLFHGDNRRKIELISNTVAFVPFGFFLSAFLSSLKRIGVWRQIGYVALASFGLSLCIESFQLILRVGFFELTDLVMNTLGGFSGACLALIGRKMLRIDKNRPHEEINY